MSATTTVRMPDQLKSRVTRAAKRAGTTPHGFILDAIAEKTAAAEHRHDFHALADKRYAAIVRSGKTLPWTTARKHLERLLATKPAQRSATHKPARKA